jgi:hypothetical protein
MHQQPHNKRVFCYLYLTGEEKETRRSKLSAQVLHTMKWGVEIQIQAIWLQSPHTCLTLKYYLVKH